MVYTKRTQQAVFHVHVIAIIKDAMNLKGRGGNNRSREGRGRNDINTTLGHERGIKKGATR